MSYVVNIDPASDGSFSAYVPDLPGCVACGDTEEEVRQLIGEAVSLHIESLREHGDPVPPPSVRAWEVAA
jgi:predicted RNase H-like HicB family nuclease